MAKKALKKAAKRASTTTKRQDPAEKLRRTLDKIGQNGHQLIPTDFGRGQYGYSTHLFGKDGRALVSVQLIRKDNGTWRVKTELAQWLRAEIEKTGFEIAERQKPQRNKQPLRSDDAEEGIIKLRR